MRPVTIYVDANASWSDNVDREGTVVGVGDVNSSILGIYTIVYNFTDQADGNHADQVLETPTSLMKPVVSISVWTDLVDSDANGFVNDRAPVFYRFREWRCQPVITVNGDANVSHEAGSEYIDLGAVWTDLVDGNGTADANGTVNENVPGTYLITYTFTDTSGNQADQVSRTVTVVDTTGPVITLNGDANHTHEAGGEYIDLGAVWTDLVDGNGTADANGTVNENELGTYSITYTFTDTSGNQATPVVRTVRVVDTTPPIITLVGDENVTHLAPLEYVDQGAVWSDLVDGSGTAEANGTVNSKVPGVYQITYSTVDAAGNSAVTVTRQVNVVDSESPVITLNGFAIHTHEAGSEYVDEGRCGLT